MARRKRNPSSEEEPSVDASTFPTASLTDDAEFQLWVGLQSADLARRISRAHDGNRGIMLTREDLDIFAASGAQHTLSNASAEALERLADQRLQARRPRQK